MGRGTATTPREVLAAFWGGGRSVAGPRDTPIQEGLTLPGPLWEASPLEGWRGLARPW